ncbi:MAG: efflux RND transporter periplasmic adaptor subunit [Alphaproteobacteria bacterium]|nr:efflux RND transporter periplasmic adaptor subunit [Alphaproteobacteria bacterium]
MRLARLLAVIPAALAAVPAAAQLAPPEPLNCVIEPRTLARVGSPDQGIIAEIKVERGDVVAAGQVLAVLDARIEQLTANLTGLQAGTDVEVRANRARAAYQRIAAQRARELNERKVMSDKNRDEALVEAEIAKLDVEAAETRQAVATAEYELAKARLDRRTIRSPIDGVVTEIRMAPGEFVHEQAPLLTVARIDELHVEVFVPIQNYGAIRLGQRATVQPVEPVGGRYPASVVAVDKVFDAASGTFGVRLRMTNPDLALPAGIRCKVGFAPGS